MEGEHHHIFEACIGKNRDNIHQAEQDVSKSFLQLRTRVPPWRYTEYCVPNVQHQKEWCQGKNKGQGGYKSCLSLREVRVSQWRHTEFSVSKVCEPKGWSHCEIMPSFINWRAGSRPLHNIYRWSILISLSICNHVYTRLRYRLCIRFLQSRKNWTQPAKKRSDFHTQGRLKRSKSQRSLLLTAGTPILEPRVGRHFCKSSFLSSGIVSLVSVVTGGTQPKDGATILWRQFGWSLWIYPAMRDTCRKTWYYSLWYQILSSVDLVQVSRLHYSPSILDPRAR